LLVLIDGRSVYNPDFAGVFWNVQDVLLEDVERIEVIRGPGGTLWGANAVNGVINIIDRLKSLDVPSYISMDLRLGWQPRKALELAVVGQNLLHQHHWEYNSGGIVPMAEIPRGVYGTISWRR